VRTGGKRRSAAGMGLDEVRYRFAQRRQLGAVFQHNRFGKTQGPGHDANPQQNRDSSRRRMVGSGKDRVASEKNRPQHVVNTDTKRAIQT
jgi:hypothetical protein